MVFAICEIDKVFLKAKMPSFMDSMILYDCWKSL